MAVGAQNHRVAIELEARGGHEERADRLFLRPDLTLAKHLRLRQRACDNAIILGAPGTAKRIAADIGVEGFLLEHESGLRSRWFLAVDRNEPPS